MLYINKHKSTMKKTNKHQQDFLIHFRAAMILTVLRWRMLTTLLNVELD